MSDFPQPGPSAPGADTAPAPARQPAWGVPALAVAALALVLAAWQWYDGRSEIGALRQEIAKKLADTDTQNKESRIVAEQVREAVTAAQVKLGVLESRLAESQSQQIALEA